MNGGYQQSPHATTGQPYPAYPPAPHGCPPGFLHPDGVSYSPLPSRQIRTRASLACDNCRNLKAKCNEGRPSCERCKNLSRECNYRDSSSQAKTEAERIQDALDAILKKVAELFEQFKDCRDRLDRIETRVEGPEAGRPVPPGELAIPTNHTTLARLLLEWPSIKALIRHCVSQEGTNVSEDPIVLERRRRPLLQYGRGVDSHAQRNNCGLTESDAATSNDASEPASPPHSDDFSDLNAVGSYVASFKTHVLNMHPILDLDMVDQKVDKFLEPLLRTPPRSTREQAARPSFEILTPPPTQVEVAGVKRKRTGDLEPLPTASGRFWKPKRSVPNALVLIILALGKICQHRESVPGAVCHANAESSSASRMIPGLEYFAYALDILNETKAASMDEVYANIFAGLYYGQLNRPLENYDSIYRAGQKLQAIMCPRLETLRGFNEQNKPPAEPQDNRFVLAFWTCLQLESDLIAELPRPPSDLLLLHDDIPYPNMSLVRGYDSYVLDSYLGQLYLRNHLNSIHRELYAPGCSEKLARDLFKLVSTLAGALSDSSWVPKGYEFSEYDPPATDILAARLRAKYWGAQVILYRHFLRQILHPCSTNPEVVGATSPDTEAKSAVDIDSSLIGLARQCIKALVESTRAFHNIEGGRPIITNVFGTAHAQWGNLLVLSAAFRNPILQQFISEACLKDLFERTMFFLRQSATSGSTLLEDLCILECVYKKLFMNEPRLRSGRYAIPHR